MKRWMLLFLMAFTALLLTSCGASAPQAAAVPAPTQAVAAVPDPDAPITAAPATDAPAAASPAPAAKTQADIDLDHMSGTMVKAQISDMTENNPDKYVGKTVLASGRYYKTEVKRLNLVHHYVLIGDELTCCAQLVEFILEGDADPGVFPDLDMPVSVQGVFEKRETEYGTVYAIVTDHLL